MTSSICSLRHVIYMVQVKLNLNEVCRKEPILAIIYAGVCAHVIKCFSCRSVD